MTFSSFPPPRLGPCASALPVLAAALAAAAPVRAEDPPPRPPKDEALELSGSHRARFETIDGQARTGFNSSDDLFSFRTILSADYHITPDVHVVGELWDSRANNGNRGTPVSTGEVNTFEPAQAYLGVALPGALGKGSKVDLQLGRFLLALGSRRLVAADEYRNTTNSSTGVRADLAVPGGWKATLVYVLPQQRLPDDRASLLDNETALDRESFDAVLWGGLVTRANTLAGAMAEVGFIHFGERDAPGRPTRDRSLDTVSARLIRDPRPGTWDFEAEGILQRGTTSSVLAANAPTQDVRAWFVHGDLGYTFAGGWKPRIAVEYDHASGDRAGGGYGRFDPIFGMRRADLAPGALYNAILRSNFISPGVRLEAVPGKKTDLMVSVRSFWLAAREDAFSSTGVRDPSGRSGSFAGHQLDARLRYRLTPKIMLEGDVVLFAKGRFLREAPNAPPGSWTRYASLNLLFNF